MARPVVRTPSRGPDAPRIRDLTAPHPPAVKVEFDARPAYDFVFSLSDEVGETDDLPAEDRRWLSTTKGKLREGVGDALDLYGSEFCIVLAGLLVDRPEVRSAADFAALLDSTSDQAILRVILGRQLLDPETRDLAERALAGERPAISSLIALQLESHGLDPEGTSAAGRRDPATLIQAARQVIGGWLPYFEPIEARIARTIQRDVELRAEDRRSLGPVELIERTTGGIRWLSEPGVTRVVLAPSYFSRPYNYVLGGEEWRLYGYPVADAALGGADPLSPPQDVVRLHRALGDETRLRILRHLRDRDLYLTEIAGLLELTKPTIKHHLALLRAAGLVTVIEEGGMTYYSLRGDRLEAASSELKRFLLG